MRQGKRNLVTDNYFFRQWSKPNKRVFLFAVKITWFLTTIFYNMKPTAADKDYATVAFGASTTRQIRLAPLKGLNPYHYLKTQMPSAK